MIDPVIWFIDVHAYQWVLVLLVRILFAASLFLLIVMSVYKVILERREAKLRRLQTFYGERVKQFIKGGASIPPLRNISEVSACADAVADLLGECSKEEAARLYAELERLDLPGRLAADVTGRRSWVRRYRALERLGFLRIPSFRPLYRQIAETDDLRLASKALWALSMVAEPQDLGFILGVISKIETLSSKFTEYLCANAIKAIAERHGDDAALETIRTVLEGDFPILVRRDLIDACGRIGFTPAAPLLLAFWHRFGDSAEIRIAVLRGLGTMEDPAIQTLLPAALVDTDWRIRVVSSGFAHLDAERTVPLLERLLGDPSYYVRLNASASLARLGSAGKAALRRALEGTDPFARDAARYRLQEAMVQR